MFVDFFEERDSGTYLDIGANIGLTTIPIARNHRVRCHSFEPDPGLFVHLLENIHRNCRRNVELPSWLLARRTRRFPSALTREAIVAITASQKKDR